MLDLSCAAAVVTTLLFGCYFMMLPWTRAALFALVPWSAITAWLLTAGLDPNMRAEAAGQAMGRSLFSLLFLIAAYRSTRNKLAFKIEPSREELTKYYESALRNASAQRSLIYGVLSIVIPLLVPVVVVFGVRGLRRAPFGAWPPAGGRGRSIVGLCCAGLSALLWGLVVLAILQRAA